MTEKEKDVIRGYVNEIWDIYFEFTSKYGANSRYATNARSLWVVLYMLWCEFFPNEDPRDEQ